MGAMMDDRTKERPAHRDDPAPPSPEPPSRMVDVGDKPLTARRAVAEGVIHLDPAARAVLDEALRADPALLEAIRVCGILAGKRTSDLLPLCHPIPMDHLAVDLESEGTGFRVTATAATRAATGVEMEALTAVTMAGLALLARLGEAGRGASLGAIRLLRKSGGRSGDFVATPGSPA
jgi:cyclic pyranopterin monophosphate synthase